MDHYPMPVTEAKQAAVGPRNRHERRRLKAFVSARARKAKRAALLKASRAARKAVA